MCPYKISLKEDTFLNRKLMLRPITSPIGKKKKKHFRTKN